MTKYLLALSLSTVALAEDDEISRRGFFTKLRDSYLQGRYTSNERRLAERREAQKAHRRAVRDRNIRKLVDGLSKRLQRGPSNIKLGIVVGVGLVVWLCYKGSIGCDGKEDDRRRS